MDSNAHEPDIDPEYSGVGLDFVPILQNPSIPECRGGLLSSLLGSGEFSLQRHKPVCFFLLGDFLSLP